MVRNVYEWIGVGSVLMQCLQSPVSSPTNLRAIAAKRQFVAALVGSKARRHKPAVLGALAKTSGNLTCRGKATQLAVLVDAAADPVDARVIADGVVHRVHHDNLKVLIGGILVHPVAVEYTEVAASLASALLSNAAHRAVKLQVLHTLVAWLAVHNALLVRAFAATTAHANAVDDKSCGMLN